MVYLTGDTHGDLDRFRHGRLRWLGKRDIVVVLGDFGFVWDGSKEEQVLDFEQVRGVFESNPFVTAVLKHIEVKTALGNELIERLRGL